MSQVKIFWDPQGIELDALGEKEFLRTTDGDTPYISMSIRMLSIDTPEVHYPGLQKPSTHDAKLKQLADWIQAGKAPMDGGLAKHLLPKLATGKAGTLQENQGTKATDQFKQLLADKLTRPDGSKRQVFLRTANQPFEQHGRLLAYMSPFYSPKELAGMSRKDRATFNLLMAESGWAATFPIYPSLPSYLDLVMLQEAGQAALDNKKGAWADPLALTGYEFRMCVRLYDTAEKLLSSAKPSDQPAPWIERYCADMTTREIFYPQEYYRVAPHNRIFIWPQDVAEAVSKMNLVAAN